jgi:uncharacterized protein
VSNKLSRLRFNFGFLLEASVGTMRTIEIDYPSIQVEDDVVLTPLTGNFDAIRNSKGIYLTGRLQSSMAVECARCLEPAVVPLSIKLDDLFYFPPTDAPLGEYSVGDDGFLDLAPLVRQLSILDIPMQPTCQADCRGLCIECGQNFNEGDCACQSDEIDPRLAALGQLLEP